MKKKLRWHTKLFVVLDIIAVAGLITINVPAFQEFWIPTAMTTMSHKYFARTFYSQEKIEEVLGANYIKSSTENINLDDIVIGGNGEKTEFESVYEEQIYTKDEGNDVYKIIRLEEDNFVGFLTAIYDPADVELAIPQNLGQKGERVIDLVSNNDGLVGINGGGFEDLDGYGDGSTPYGSIIYEGELIYSYPGGSGELIGFTEDHKLYLTDESPEEAIANGMYEAVEFGPNLIVNGKVTEIEGNGGWGVAPRTIIAQRKDGIVLFLIIDGRQPGYSDGATMNEVIEVLIRYGAYNAANLDGGGSTTMAVGNKLYNKPSAGVSQGGRYVSNGFIVTNHTGKNFE